MRTSRRRATRRSRRSVVASVRVARSPRASTRPAPRARCLFASARGDAGCQRRSPSRRTRRRSRAASPVRHRVRTTTRRARGTRARPSSWRGARRPRAMVGNGSGGRSSTVVRRPCTLPARARASASDSATTHSPCLDRAHGAGSTRAPAAPRRGRRVARCRRRNPRSPHGTSAPTRCATPPSSSARRAAASNRRDRGDDGTRVLGREARSPRRSSASRCSGTGARRARGRRRSGGSLPRAISAAARTRIPGVQNPHCDAPVATNASTSRSRSAASSPSSVVTDRPATRSTGVTHATRGSPSTSTVQHPHWPCGAQPSFTDTSRRAARAGHVEERFARFALDVDGLAPSH